MSVSHTYFFNLFDVSDESERIISSTYINYGLTSQKDFILHVYGRWVTHKLGPNNKYDE